MAAVFAQKLLLEQTMLAFGYAVQPLSHRLPILLIHISRWSGASWQFRCQIDTILRLSFALIAQLLLLLRFGSCAITALGNGCGGSVWGGRS